ncbi:EEF1A lysine methyltransferase 1 [Linum grandiflorum]
MEEQQTLRHEIAGEEEEDEAPTLSSHALAALHEFLAEQSRSEEAEETNGGETSVELVSEDWRLSQFWYDKSTAETVANEVISLCRDGGENRRVACIACPTLYAYIKKIDPNLSVQLLEYDERFGRYGGDFTLYDYNKPEELPAELKQSFSVVVADPPYLSKECLEKVAETVSFLAKPAPSDSYVLLLTVKTGFVQGKCRRKGLLNCWDYVRAGSGLSIRANSGTSFVYSQTITLRLD